MYVATRSIDTLDAVNLPLLAHASVHVASIVHAGLVATASSRKLQGSSGGSTLISAHEGSESVAQRSPDMISHETATNSSNMLDNVSLSASHGNHTEPPPTFATTEEMYPVDVSDANPWLAWNWCEPTWDTLDSMPTSTGGADSAYNGSAPIIPTDQLLVGAGHSSPASFDSRIQALGDGQLSLTNILDAKIDPVEHHRQTIVTYIISKQAGAVTPVSIQWLARAHFPFLLKSYFTRHHRHTQIVHLPTFNIVTCPTSLIFALALIAASYERTLGLRTASTIAIAKSAYDFALETDEGIRTSGQASLETLQALLLLGILDRLMMKRPFGSTHVIDLGKIARLARKANMFEDPGNGESASWQVWATWEARRRLGLVLFAFDAFISILHDETPSVLADELNLKFPGPEFLFMAPTKGEWQEKRRLVAHTIPPCPVSVTLSSLLCTPAKPIQLPNTLMGRFVLLHGVLQHAWRTKRVFLAEPSLVASLVVEPYLSHKADTIHTALHTWREGWPENLLDFDPCQESPSLYQDRAAACWCLAGILTLPHVLIASSRYSATEHGPQLSIQQILERLMILSDHNRLDRWQQDFDATYDLVMEVQQNDVGDAALGGLIYREADTTKAGFEA